VIARFYRTCVIGGISAAPQALIDFLDRARHLPGPRKAKTDALAALRLRPGPARHRPGTSRDLDRWWAILAALWRDDRLYAGACAGHRQRHRPARPRSPAIAAARAVTFFTGQS
jgi:hypothetical protein